MKRYIEYRTIIIFLLAICLTAVPSCKKEDHSNTIPAVTKPPVPPTALTRPPANLLLNRFYKKYVDTGGIPIVNREGLKNYDPALYNLISQYFTHENIKNGCY